MDIFEHEKRFEDAGIQHEHARVILQAINSGDTQAMTKADGDRLETNLRREFNAKFEAIDTRFEAMDIKFDAKFDALDAKLEAMTHKLIATVWTVGGVAVAVLVGIDRVLGV